MPQSCAPLLFHTPCAKPMNDAWIMGGGKSDGGGGVSNLAAFWSDIL